MTTANPSLTSLPVEIQCAIYKFLDPGRLMSISQTNRKERVATALA